MKKQVQKEKMDVVFLLDRSGSMSRLTEDTIGGYNSYLDKMKDTNSLVTTVLFDHEYEMVTKRQNIKEIKKLDNKTYFTRGNTALLDAIGKTIKFLDKQKTNKVLFIITTDGYENASIEYNKGQIKELIEGHSNWEFIYIGAGIDSYGEASSMGIKKERTSNCEKSAVGMSNLFNSVSKLSKCYFECDSINENWNEELENYIKDSI